MYSFRTTTTTLVDGCVPGMGIMDHGSWSTNPRTVNLFRRALRGTGTITGNHVPWTEYGQLHVTPTTAYRYLVLLMNWTTEDKGELPVALVSFNPSWYYGTRVITLLSAYKYEFGKSRTTG